MSQKRQSGKTGGAQGTPVADTHGAEKGSWEGSCGRSLCLACGRPDPPAPEFLGQNLIEGAKPVAISTGDHAQLNVASDSGDSSSDDEVLHAPRAAGGSEVCRTCGARDRPGRLRKMQRVRSPEGPAGSRAAPSPSCAREARESHVPPGGLGGHRQSGTRGSGVRSGADASGTFFCARGRAPRTTRLRDAPLGSGRGPAGRGARGRGADTLRAAPRPSREGAVPATPRRPR